MPETTSPRVTSLHGGPFPGMTHSPRVVVVDPFPKEVVVDEFLKEVVVEAFAMVVVFPKEVVVVVVDTFVQGRTKTALRA